MKYRAEIDGLRALAVLPVIFFHAGFEWFSGGFVGVDVFFVISGYLITTIIISEMAEDKFSIINFYERRARRILPALFFVMLATIPFSLLLLSPSDLKDYGESLISTSTFSSNILFWWERGYFGTALELKPLLHTWSLAVEEQYYIFFPVFLIFTWQFGLKKISILLSIIFLISLGLAHFSSVYGVYDRVITGSFYLIPTRAWELLVGVFIAFYLGDIQKKINLKFNQFLSVLGFLLVVISIIYFDEHTPFPSFYTLIPILGTALLIVSAVKGTIINKILSYKHLVFIGLISYSAYLWHQPIFAFSRHYFVDLSKPEFLFLSVLSLCIAYISWKWVERPFRDKNKITRKGIFIFSITTTIFFITIGSVFTFTNGFLSKYSKIEQNIYREFINLGTYTPINMKEVNLREFSSKDKRQKLLVIGDSYAEDLVNAIEESSLKNKYQLSSYRIPAVCGVLYIEKSRLQDFQPNSCNGRPNFFNEPELIQLISHADEVWIESSWMLWQLEFLEESLNRIKEKNKNLVLFGSKQFDIKNASQYRNKYGLEKITKEFNISENHINLTNRLQIISELVGIKFLDPMFIICGSKSKCKHSYDGEGIISVDGGHLTPYGAAHFGDELEKWILENN